MSEKTLSIFIDESGRFQYPDPDSPFYILGMVLHDQSQGIEKHVADLERLELKIKNSMPLTCSENRFFGGPRDFQRNILKRIKRKEI